MGGIFADGHDDDEKWLKEHRKHFPRTNPALPGHKARTRKAGKPPIIPIGKTTQTCPTCKVPAPVETFKNAKCLGCQAQEFLSTL